MGSGGVVFVLEYSLCHGGRVLVVRLTGVLPQYEVAALMRRARIFVLHSNVAPDGESEASSVVIV